jgi:hypothetical protein
LTKREAHQPPHDGTIACRLLCNPCLLTFPSNNETYDVSDECPANWLTFNRAGN